MRRIRGGVALLALLLRSLRRAWISLVDVSKAKGPRSWDLPWPGRSIAMEGTVRSGTSVRYMLEERAPPWMSTARALELEDWEPAGVADVYCRPILLLKNPTLLHLGWPVSACFLL